MKSAPNSEKTAMPLILPCDITHTIFTFLKGDELSKIRIVCSQWNQIIDANSKTLPLHIIDEKFNIYPPGYLTLFSDVKPFSLFNRCWLSELFIDFANAERILYVKSIFAILNI